MTLIEITTLDLSIAAVFILLLSLLSYWMQIGNASQILIATLRNFIQLSAIAYVLQFIFNNDQPWQILAISLIMLFIAGWEIYLRQTYKLKQKYSLYIGTISLFISTFILTYITLKIIIEPTPWYSPQYAIPLLGILLGNTMNAISLAINSMTQELHQQRFIIEQRLMLGQTSDEAIRDIRNNAIKTGMIPIINSMATAGLVSLPGMMTGQILAGTEPYEAAHYQILIFYLISAGSGFSTILATWMISRNIFDHRHRLEIGAVQKR